MFDIVDSSPVAAKILPSHSAKSKYPFEKLEVGKSFTVKTAEIKWESLRSTVYQRNAKDTDKEFAFVKHDEMGICEVARIK